METERKYSKYLPSRKFAMVVVGGVLFFVFLMGFAFVFFSKEEKVVVTNDAEALRVQEQTVVEIMESDLDKDGILDWEETLWGTDRNKKSTFGIPDMQYVDNKKAILKSEQEKEDKVLTETDKFARQFFIAYTAMKSSGKIDSQTINNFSSALGQKIVTSDLGDVYTERNIRVDTNPNEDSINYYAEEISNLFEEYKLKGIGEELDIIATGLSQYSDGGSTNYDELKVIGEAYQNFAKDIMNMTVPSDLKEYHLSIANSANNTGISVVNMVQMVNDPLVGLSGLSQYQKYSKGFVDNVNALESFLTNY